MAKAPAFQFYAADFLTDVMDWTDEEVGVHIRLLAWSWVNRRGIPRDTQRLTRIAPKALEAWPVIKDKWSEGPNETWVNDKLESTRSDSDAFRASQRERSLLAVAARQGKIKPKGKPTGSPKDKPMGSPMGDPLEGEEEVLIQRRKERAGEKPHVKWTAEDFQVKCAEVMAETPDRLPADQKRPFFDYWTESDGRGKMRFQSEKFFDVGRRMDNWKRRNEQQRRPAKAIGNPTPAIRQDLITDLNFDQA